MEKREGTLTPYQLFALIHLSMVATGIFTLPREVADAAGRGGIISVLLGGALTGLQLLGMYLLASRFPRQSLGEYAPQVLGRFLSWVFLSGYFIIKTVLFIAIARNFWFVVNAWMLRETPMMVFVWALGLLTWQATRRGVVVFTRVSELVFLLVQPLWVLAVISAAEVNPGFLRPLLDEGVLPIVQGILPVYFAMTGFDLFLFVFPYTTQKSARQIGLWGIAYTTFLYITITVLALGVLGLELTLIEVWPLKSVLSVIVLPVIERVDTFFGFYWTLQVVITLVAFMYVSRELLRGVFRRLSAHAATDIVGVLFLAGSLWPLSFDQLGSLLDAFSLLSLVWVGSLPWVLWLVAVLRKKGGNRHDGRDQKAA